MTLSFAPLVPWQMLALLAAPAGLVFCFAVFRGAAGAWWRGLAFLILVLGLANPRLAGEEREPQSDIAVLLIDRTASQDMDGRAERLEAALETLRAELADMEGLDVRETVLRDHADGTLLNKTLTRALSDVAPKRLAGVVVLTDGRAHDKATGTKPAGPVHALLTGRRAESDRRMAIARAPAYGIVGGEARISFRVEDETGGPAPVKLRVDGREVPLAVGNANTERIAHFPVERAGPMVVELEAEVRPGELTPLNNRAVLTVNGVRDRLRVLLVSGQPHPGERVWRNLLKSDPSVDLAHFTILRPPEKEDYTPLNELSLIPFPVKKLFEDSLGDFDLVVLDRYVVRDMLPPRYYRNMVARVRDGGALLAAVGPELAGPRSLAKTALSDILPMGGVGEVTEGPFRPMVSDVGRRHPVTVGLGGDWGRWYRMVETTPGNGTALMEGPDARPLLVLDRVGEGRVAFLASDHVWLWARNHDGGGPHGELLRRLAHWLMREPDLEEERLVARVENGRLLVRRRSLDDPPPSVLVTGPDGTKVAIPLEAAGPGLAKAETPVDKTGLYRVDDGERVALAASGPANPVELAEPGATDALLAPLADRTGGGVFRLEDGTPSVRPVGQRGPMAGRDWLGLRRNGAYVVTGLSDRPMLPGLLWLIPALAAAAMAWRREGK